MQRIMRIACLGYFVFLTLLLLTADPARLIVASGELPWILRALMPWAHLLSFSVLAVAMLLARWPVPRWSVVLILAMYGGATEIIQGFVPPRTPKWIDWFQDLGGLAGGAAICWIVALLTVRISHHIGQVVNSVPLLRRSSAECNPLPVTACKQAVTLGGERWALGRASLARFFRMLAGMVLLLLPLVMAGDLARAGPQDFGAIVSRHADATYSQLLAGLPKRSARCCPGCRLWPTFIRPRSSSAKSRFPGWPSCSRSVPAVATCW